MSSKRRAAGLRRLRLDEPLEPQLARLRAVTWVLTGLLAGIGLFMFGLFTAFQRPGIGLIVASVVVLPLAVLAWREERNVRRAAAEYAKERGERVEGAR